jgi:hypothetical protein
MTQRSIWRAGLLGLLLALAGCGGGDSVDDPTAAEQLGEPAEAPAPDVVAALPDARETVEGRIAAALGAGRIDAETALAYRVFALYGDARLPAELRDDGVAEPPAGDDAAALDRGEAVDGNAVIHDLRQRWDGLSAPTQHMLAPFRARPLVAGSWLPDGDATAAREQAAVARPSCGATATWASIAPATAKVRVWYDKTRPADLTQAQATAAALDTKIWPKLITTLGFKAPLSDLALACDGGDSRLDIYIVANLGARGATYPESASAYQSSTFIVLRSGQSGSALLYAITHQFMHAIQWSYLMIAPQTSYGWMRNALANWAVEAVYPGNVVLRADASCHMNSTFLPITDRSAGACASSTTRTRDYGAYLLYQYIGRTAGNTKVRELLAATTTITSALGAINTLVTGGLRTLWPKYAKTLWNQVPVTNPGRPAFFNWDGLATVPALAPDRPTPVNANIGIAAEATTSLSSSVANTSTRFYRFTISQTATRSLMFRNTFYPLYKAGKKVSVQAMWRTAAGTWVEENWTANEWIGICRDRKAQRLTELVVVVASGEVGSVTQVVASIVPTFKRNNIGCWGYSGSVKRTDQDSGWSSGSIVLAGTARFDYQGGGGALQYNDPATGRLRVPIAAPLLRNVSWTLAEAYADNGCTYALNKSGTSGSIVLGGTAAGGITMNNFAESLPSSLRLQQYALLGAVRGAYTMNLVSNAFGIAGTVSGPQPDCGTTYQSALGVFALTNASAGTGPVIRIDGRLAGTFVQGSGGDTSTWAWSLSPLLEP